MLAQVNIEKNHYGFSCLSDLDKWQAQGEVKVIV